MTDQNLSDKEIVDGWRRGQISRKIAEGLLRENEERRATRCDQHPAYEADYCPSCGTSAQIGQ